MNIKQNLIWLSFPILLLIVSYSGMDQIEKGVTTILIVGAYGLHYLDKRITAIETACAHKNLKFKCKFSKRLIRHDESIEDITEGVLLESFYINIPFAPIQGMSLYDLLDASEHTDENGIEYVDGVEFYAGEITKIHWNNCSKIFECEVSPHIFSQEINLGKVLHFYEQKGWKLCPLALEAKQELEKYKNSIDDDV